MIIQDLLAAGAKRGKDLFMTNGDSEGPACVVMKVAKIDIKTENT